MHVIQELNRYLASHQLVEIIYVDRENKLSQRKVMLKSIEGGSVKAFCMTKHAVRSFSISNILALLPTTLTQKAV